VYVLKFEAEGYQSFTTRIIAADEGEAKFDVRLNHAQSKYLTVLRPDRQPAVLVNVSLVGKDSDFVRIVNGAVVYRWANGKVSMVTDTNGMAPFNVETEVTHVGVADPMGFSSQSFAEVEKNPRIRLQSWASVSGTIRNAPNVIEVKSVRIKSFWKTGKYALVEVPVDDNGSFNADFVPPGHLSVEPRPLVKVRDFNWPKAWPKAEVEIAPAATTNLVFNFLEFGAAATR